jgi:hypothetical protein
MEEDIRDIGKTVNSMEKENFLIPQQANGEKEYGMMENESDG